jgi:hypothetical protein
MEYNNQCYKVCPAGTHNSTNIPYLCEQDLICEKYYNYTQTGCLDYIPDGYYLNDTIKNTINKCINKCSTCSRDSIVLYNNLCTSCNNNDGYFQIFIDYIKNNTFFNCYNNKPEAHYLDINKKIYMPCFSTCKNCDKFGSPNNNMCTECYSNYTLTLYIK